MDIRGSGRGRLYLVAAIAVSGVTALLVPLSSGVPGHQPRAATALPTMPPAPDGAGNHQHRAGPSAGSTPGTTAHLASSLAAGPGAASPTRAPATSAPAGSGAVIYAYTGYADPAATVASLPSVVHGVSWIFSWRQIEPSPGAFNWSTVDAAIAASSASGRQTMLRIQAGAFSPSWVPNQLTMTFQPMGGGPLQTVTMPRPWDPTYISDWVGFIRAYGARYDGDRRVTMIQMPGGGYQGEMALPQWPGWVSAGYTDSAMASAWYQFIDAYRSAFPHHPTVIDFGEPLQVYAHSHIVPEVLAHAERYGSAMRYQQNGLHSGLGENIMIFQTLRALANTTTVGWQMSGGTSPEPSLIAAFKVAIDSHAGYVEVYRNQCTNPADMSALQYLAGGG